MSGGREGECGVSVEGRKAGRVIWDEIEGNRSGFKSCRRDGKGEEEEGVCGSEWGGGEGCVGRSWCDPSMIPCKRICSIQ